MGGSLFVTHQYMVETFLLSTCIVEERVVDGHDGATGVAEDGLHAVVEGEDLDEPLDDVVEAGAEPARREDGDARPAGVVEDLLVRAGALEGRLVAEALAGVERIMVGR